MDVYKLGIGAKDQSIWRWFKYKFWWSGSEEGRNGVGIIVKEDLVEKVIEVKRLDDE